MGVNDGETLGFAGVIGLLKVDGRDTHDDLRRLCFRKSLPASWPSRSIVTTTRTSTRVYSTARSGCSSETR